MTGGALQHPPHGFCCPLASDVCLKAQNLHLHAHRPDEMLLQHRARRIKTECAQPLIELCMKAYSLTYQRLHEKLQGCCAAQVRSLQTALLIGPKRLPLHSLHVLDQASNSLLLLLLHIDTLSWRSDFLP